jgi:signal peptidase I
VQIITAIILAAFSAYIGAWYLGALEGNFALLLFLATSVTGVYWVLEKTIFLPQRLKESEAIETREKARQEELIKMGLTPSSVDLLQAREEVLRQPWWLDWTAGLFPVILVVFILRSFLFEPFKIPSGSMIPTLWVGDLILVNKFHYGIRLPVINTKITQGEPVQRGDVMVFRYPPNPSLDYIKRVVGLPGDTVSYINKELKVNGVDISKTAVPDFFEEESLRYIKQFEEVLPRRDPSDAQGSRVTHRLLNEMDRPAYVSGADQFPFRENCQYSVDGVVCKVPPGHYFMMGDNRDNSLDSRYWGFVPDSNVVGRAFFVWMNFGNLKRIGAFD